MEAVIARGALNDSQARAMRLILETRLATVQGPPGCGKTKVADLMRVAFSASMRDG